MLYTFVSFNDSATYCSSNFNNQYPF